MVSGSETKELTQISCLCLAYRSLLPNPQYAIMYQSYHIVSVVVVLLSTVVHMIYLYDPGYTIIMT